MSLSCVTGAAQSPFFDSVSLPPLPFLSFSPRICGAHTCVYEEDRGQSHVSFSPTFYFSVLRQKLHLGELLLARLAGSQVRRNLLLLPPALASPGAGDQTESPGLMWKTVCWTEPPPQPLTCSYHLFFAIHFFKWLLKIDIFYPQTSLL